MNLKRIEASWHELKGTARSEWARLTDDQLARIKGKREALESALTRRYGWLKDRVEKTIDGWIEKLDPGNKAH